MPSGDIHKTLGFVGLNVNREIRNDNTDLGVVNKVTEILKIDKIFRPRVWSKQKAEPRQIPDKYAKRERH